MPDYINREKLLEHIKDAPTWEIDDKGVHDTKYPKGMFDCEDVVSSIENAPAADVEHVIRCKDCVNSATYPWRPEDCLWCPVNNRPVRVDDFCCEGTKKEEVEQ